MNRKIRELKRKLRQAIGLRNTFGDHIIIKDEVRVYEGKKLLFKSKGHIVNQALICLINLMSCKQIDSNIIQEVPSGGTSTGAFWSALNSGKMYVGTGVGVTVGTMIDLVINEGTIADSQSGVTSSPVAGTYRVSWTAVWNAGTLAAIDVSELGLFLWFDKVLKAFESYPTLQAVNLFSRLSDADGDFTTFTVNTGVPLTIEWRLTFTFA